jgi:isoamylase
MQLVLFDEPDDLKPVAVIELDRHHNRTAHYWHVFIPGVLPGRLYGFRANGPNDPAHGERFDPQKLLLDPYGKGVAVGKNYSRAEACRAGDNAATSMKSVVADMHCFDWENDKPLGRPFQQTVIYEMHVAGFTLSADSGVKSPNKGTYLGVIEKIPHLLELGITAVELLPVFHFDVQAGPENLTDYWGYNPVSFFAPHLGYGTGREALVCLDEFREMVKQLHRAGIEVILDVVYNHTSEGGEGGPTLCFRGLEDSAYYILGDQGGNYVNDTGAGNTLKTNGSVVKRLILDSLKHWVSEMHVDGFRFDLASVFSRDDMGTPMSCPAILRDIDSDPGLAGTKLIAEAWDEGGLYQVGNFGRDRWNDWNGPFRDDIRAFLKGDRDTAWKLRERISGSFDLYGTRKRPAGQGINYVTCHDGFTLNDLVSYDHKHNEANLEANGDGTNANFSWNCGAEGPTANEDIKALRTRQIKNALTLTLLSVGTPMLLMGDEVGRTQAGNNNAYCQNNTLSWLQWKRDSSSTDMLRFTQAMIRLRGTFERKGLLGQTEADRSEGAGRIEWHGTRLDQPDWSSDSHSLAYAVRTSNRTQACYVAINAYWTTLEFELPTSVTDKEGEWTRIVDTSLQSPHDIVDQSQSQVIVGRTYIVSPRSIVILWAASKEAGAS